MTTAAKTSAVTLIRRSYWITLHLLLAVLVIKTDFIPKVKVRLGLAAPTPNVHVPNMRMIHAWMDDSVPEGATLFIGDSIVQGLATAAITDYAINYGIGSLTAAQLVDMLPDYRSLHRANAIVLSVGINDILMGEQAHLLPRYQKILALLPADKPLVWNAVLPTRLRDMDPAVLREVNARISTLCAARPHCVVADASAQLTDAEGAGLRAMYLDDGIHLAAAGYAVLIQALRTGLHQVINPT